MTDFTAEILETSDEPKQRPTSASAHPSKDERASMPKAKPTRRRSNGHAPELASDFASPPPRDIERLRETGWLADFLKGTWPIVFGLLGAIIAVVFAAGRLDERVTAISTKIEGHDKVLTEIKETLNDFRLQWVSEQAKEAATKEAADKQATAPKAPPPLLDSLPVKSSPRNQHVLQAKPQPKNGFPW